MKTFLELFEALMDEQFGGNRARFQELSGASSAYLTAIAKGRQLPRPAALDEWLKKAGIPDKKRERLVFQCRYEKLQADEDLAPLVTYFEGRARTLAASFRRAAEMCAKAGIKLPGDLIQQVKSAEQGGFLGSD